MSLLSDFYDQFPYQPDSLREDLFPSSRWCFSVKDALDFCNRNIGNYKSSSSQDTFQILDAGCGTGFSTDYLASLNEGSEIIAVDISRNSIEAAKDRLRKSRGDQKSKLIFKNMSFLKLDEEYKFDYINSMGVLQHLEDPLDGLQKLSSLLKPRSILHLFLYAAVGRIEIKRVRNVFDLIGINHDTDDLKLARELFSNLPKNNAIRRNYEEIYSKESLCDANFADMYLNPREVCFTVKDLCRLISSSDLHFAGFSNPSFWDLSRLLNNELLRRASSLSVWKQFELIESLDPGIRYFEFFLIKDPFLND